MFNEISIKSFLIYMYKQDSALNYQQWLICHKNKLNQTSRYKIIPDKLTCH